jgi:septum formation protein
MPFSSQPKLILASASPRRRDLLTEHGYEFEIVPANVREISPGYLSPGEIVLYNAHAKALHVSRLHPEALVVGVDTVVVFNERIMGKPRTMEEAVEMLRRLNGEEHEVYSGVWIMGLAERRSRGFIESTRVRFHKRTLPEILAYLARIGPLDKAGAYAAQDDHGEMIRAVEGSFTNVIGLPMERLAEELQMAEAVYA